MPKYEIMIIINPNSDKKIVETLAKETLNKSLKIEVMKQTELAYEINNSKFGKYILINVETDGKNIKEFTRKINITKDIWRYLIVNREHELKLEDLTKKAKQKMEKRKKQIALKRGNKNE